MLQTAAYLSVSLKPLRWKNRNNFLVWWLGNVSIEAKSCNWIFLAQDLNFFDRLRYAANCGIPVFYIP